MPGTYQAVYNGTKAFLNSFSSLEMTQASQALAIECGPIGCRPLPLGCRQVSLGGRWIDNNGRRVVCDKRGRTSR